MNETLWLDVVASGAYAHVTMGLMVFGLLQNTALIVMLPFAWLELRRQGQVKEDETAWQIETSGTLPTVSVIVPAYNEESAIVDVTRSMLRLRYGAKEVVIVNDGSRDGTLARLVEAFALQPVVRAWQPAVPCSRVRGIYASPLHPALVVVDKEPGGCKADAANAGINLARNELICVIDADSLLEPDSLTRAVRPFLEDAQTVAVGGTIRILNGCELVAGRVARYAIPRSYLPLMQVMEYQRAFLGARLALSRWRMLTLISGAFSLFRRDIAIACGGFGTDTVGEDYDLVMKMHRHLCDLGVPYAMHYLADTVCWTEAPSDWRGLGTQRRRWQLGGLQVFAKHRAMFLRPRYGRVGMGGMALAFVCDVAGPVGELLGFVLLGLQLLLAPATLSPSVLWLAGVVLLLGLLCTYLTLVLDSLYARWTLTLRERLVLLGAALLENIGYRQVNSWWRLQAGWMFLRGQSGWGSIARMNRADPAQAPGAAGAPAQ